MGLLWTTALLYSYFKLFYKRLFGTLRSYPHVLPQSDYKPVCIVTGATSGLGKSTAEALSVQGYHVILAGRSFQCLSKTIAEIQHRHEGVSLKAIELDLCSLESILKFKDSVLDWLKAANLPSSLQLLVNNAGILATSQGFTSGGYDRMMASNYLGAFMLTHLLLPLLQSSSCPPRIVNVASFTHWCVQDIQVNEANLAKGDVQNSSNLNWYQLARIYESTKLYLILFTFELHRQLYIGNHLHPISVTAADPGAVETRILREVPNWLSFVIFKVMKYLCLMQSPTMGSRAIVDAALAPPEASGKYFFGGGGRTIEPSTLSNDSELAQKLWKASASLLHIAT
ncbi:hypothetical protein SUGI_0325530 [Cryptomeria japonica]|nr:hypothetical protein SUGI_0325530 [Cryptomeria japonica]